MRRKGGRAGGREEKQEPVGGQVGWTEREDTVTMTGTETPELPRDRQTDADGNKAAD